MMDASAWRVPLRSLDSTEAQGLTAACLVSTKILQAFGNFILSSSVRHSVEVSSTSREPSFDSAATLQPFVQRRRRLAFDSASKECRVNAGQPGLGFAFAEVQER